MSGFRVGRHEIGCVCGNSTAVAFVGTDSLIKKVLGRIAFRMWVLDVDSIG